MLGMAKKFVIYQGERMIEGWPEKIQADQKHRTVLISGLGKPRSILSRR